MHHQIPDWLNNKNDMYVFAGKDYPMKKIIIAKVLDISIRATGYPPGYDIMIFTLIAFVIM